MVGESVHFPSSAPDSQHLSPFRLGQSQHTHYGLQRIPEFTHAIITVTLGQDHTLALTTSGEVLSWGSNRFSQLGYVIEPLPSNTSGFERIEEPIQTTPRRIHGQIRKEFVRGIAASKMSSACWTSREVFTWGTNNGQLGTLRQSRIRFRAESVRRI